MTVDDLVAEITPTGRGEPQDHVTLSLRASSLEGEGRGGGGGGVGEEKEGNSKPLE